MAHLLELLRHTIESVILTFGYPGITFLMLLENIFPPIPSEVVLPFTGSLVAAGKLNLVGVLLASTLGGVAGTSIFYYLGHRWGEPRTRKLVTRYGRFIAVDEGELERTLHTFYHHKRSVIFFGRFLPAIRTLISLPAGISRMPLGQFLLYTTLGTFVWNALLIGAGVVLGNNWQSILSVVDRFETIFWILIVLVLLYFGYTRLRKVRQRNSA